MSLREKRRDARRAELRLEVERLRWRIRTHDLRAHFARHREVWLVGGGIGSGLLAGLLPWKAGANLGRLVVGLASLALRSPLGALLIDATRRRTAEGRS